MSKPFDIDPFNASQREVLSEYFRGFADTFVRQTPAVADRIGVEYDPVTPACEFAVALALEDPDYFSFGDDGRSFTVGGNKRSTSFGRFYKGKRIETLTRDELVDALLDTLRQLDDTTAREARYVRRRSGRSDQ